MVVGRVQPIDPDSRQVLHVESNKSRPKPVTHILHLLGVQLVLEFASELVSLKLEASTDGVHSHPNNGFYGHEDHLEQNERQNRRGLCRNFFREVKCSEEPWGVNEGREESEDREDVDLRNDEELCWVHVVPVAKFMSKDGFYFLSLALLDQGIEDDDMFAPWEAKEVGIAVRAALGTINLVQVLERELELRSQTFNPFPKAAFREWRQFVEEWLNNSRVDEDHQDLEREQERHQERNKAVTSPLENLQEGGKERCTECESDQPTFDSIRDKQPRGCLVEPVLFLENEGLISGKWNAWDRGDKE